jgi:membrane protein implicated in regulation of membrane protease activity
MITFWGICILVFLIIEGVTFGLASIWFAIGGIVALVAALVDAPVWLQVVLFILVSFITLLLTRPLAKKYVNTKKQPTNADRYIGMLGYVTEEINNLTASGTVIIDGKVWTARSVSNIPIPKGNQVKVCQIEGVKLIVTPVVPATANTIQ